MSPDCNAETKASNWKLNLQSSYTANGPTVMCPYTTNSTKGTFLLDIEILETFEEIYLPYCMRSDVYESFK